MILQISLNFLFFHFVSSSYGGGICSRQVKLTKVRTITYSSTYLEPETYRCWVWLFECVKYKIACCRQRTKNETYYDYKTDQFCCAGYYKQLNASALTCDPICSNPCSNGTCVAPDTCSCNHGYELDENTCNPQCSNGTCISGDGGLISAAVFFNSRNLYIIGGTLMMVVVLAVVVWVFFKKRRRSFMVRNDIYGLSERI